MPRRRPRTRSPLLPDDPDVKPCLRCRNLFRSVGKGNRLCDRCNESNRSLSRRESTTRSTTGRGAFLDLLPDP